MENFDQDLRDKKCDDIINAANRKVRRMTRNGRAVDDFGRLKNENGRGELRRFSWFVNPQLLREIFWVRHYGDKEISDIPRGLTDERKN